MNRTEFDRALRRGIRGLPKAHIQRFSEHYAEMLDDRIESGMTEEAAVAQLDDPAAIAAQILSDASLPEVKRWQERLMRRPHAWEVVLIVLGSPVWLSLALALFSVALALFVVMWSLIVVIWAMELAFALSALAGIAFGIAAIFRINAGVGAALLGGGIFCAGAMLVWFEFSKWVTVSLLHALGGIKNRWMMKGQSGDE